ncbi:Peptidyl-prolyl cis-trans isomerase pin4 [Exophiala xenobiotica]|uniref:Peptidyl-prolyl cis-trans isomerase pin4 n=1 Tax=Lithohypha guttulata TaxID=1690604 RepID=A0ABR0K6K9_9EURO|nr:Peptidyl-prolyl cis-trans isomerase pin4 [Lithohypha guttulata]KAK5314965.1 Peptidyl-prolyl cis-trans isomerase pin4 [Exophiala xenobiotica]
MNEGFYDHPTSRSPRSYRNHQPQLNRANGRPMDSAYGSMQGAMYTNNTSYNNNNNNVGQSLRFGGGPFGPSMQNGPVGNVHFPYDSAAAQTWNAGSNGIPNFGTGFGGPQDPSRSVRPSRGRGPVSNLWDDSAYPPQQSASQIGRQPSLNRQDLPDDDELIPTAIVIKNIPFAVKKESLVELMVNMNLPLPYAFNYHFDNGVFRGLAFANFTSPNETEQVIQALNHMELSGRKLRVEYKKMLPLAERERIEREKRERRGQLEEQHRPLPQNQLHTQVSMSALSQARNTPSPLSHRQQSARPGPDIDMNDPVTLEFYTQLTLFKMNNEPETLIFPQDLPPENRRLVHTLAHHMGLLHTSHGMAEQRQVHVQRPAAGSNISPPNSTVNARQGLVRTSTTEYGEGRPYDGPNYAQLRGQASVGLLDVGDNNAFGRHDNSNLRNAKSYADLRTWSPSPAPSAASFPAALQTNGVRLQAIGDTAGSNTPTLTPVGSNSAMGIGRDEPFLISGFNNLHVGNGLNHQTSPRRQRSNFFNGTSTWEDQPAYQSTAPIGSKRTVSIGADNSAPLRQSRGPTSNNTMGFRRHNGRGSDELRTAASAIAE